MFFNVCEHYDDNYPKEIVYDNECFICFEISRENEIKPINLKNQCIYFKICDCDGCVHERCLKLWFDNSNSCPICRKITFKTISNIIILLNYIPYNIFIFVYIKRVTLHFLRFLSILFFIYSLFDFYFLTIKIKNKQINEDNYFQDIYNITY